MSIYQVINKTSGTLIAAFVGGENPFNEAYQLARRLAEAATRAGGYNYAVMGAWCDRAGFPTELWSSHGH